MLQLSDCFHYVSLSEGSTPHLVAQNRRSSSDTHLISHWILLMWKHNFSFPNYRSEISTLFFFFLIICLSFLNRAGFFVGILEFLLERDCGYSLGNPRTTTPCRKAACVETRHSGGKTEEFSPKKSVRLSISWLLPENMPSLSASISWRACTTMFLSCTQAEHHNGNSSS